ncbi:MAG: ketol-acid reductoisomerase [Armatimonadetes bacterium]|nr:ketol-acid reductoisomerase [Armatimonadota bacterium]
MPTIIPESDIDPSLIKGKTVAIIGYGNQGRAHSLNLRDRGITVLVGQRRGGQGWKNAVSDGFEPTSLGEATSPADFVVLALPDESMAEVYEEQISKAMTPGKTLLVCHGFSIHFGFLKPRQDIDVVLAAPKGSGASLRKEVSEGRSMAGLVAVHQDVSGQALGIALSYTWGIGCHSTVIHTTFEEECVTDLFGEQAVLCGGIPELIKAAFDTLVEAGYSPESAYLECLHEAKLITDLLYERGLTGMREAISDTAEWGGYRAGKLLIDESVKERMRQVLGEIRSGKFAEEWVAESKTGKKRLHHMREEESRHAIEDVGRRLRERMLKMDDN